MQFSGKYDHQRVTELLDYLSTQPDNGYFQKWRFDSIDGGGNNLLYHATSGQNDLAIKFTIRDKRHRARREFNALLALQQTGLNLAPHPILLDEESYAQPVVVQSWVKGIVKPDVPKTDGEWELLIAHYAALSQITPEEVSIPIEKATINFANVMDGLTHIQKQLDLVPKAHHPESLTQLLDKLMDALATIHSFTPTPSFALCRVDSNTLNFIRKPNGWMSVDWENSGWGDLAFEIAELMTHPKYNLVSSERWDWVIQTYGKYTRDETATQRIHLYYPLMLVWWVARLVRSHYEVPRGLDERLVKWPSDWLTRNQKLYEHYLQLAKASLNYFRTKTPS